MMDHSFSISFGDSILNKEERVKVSDLTKKYYEDVNDILKTDSSLVHMLPN